MGAKAVIFTAFSLLLLLHANSSVALVDWPACRTENGTTNIAAAAASRNVTLNTSLTDVNQAFLLINSSGASDVSAGGAHLVDGYIANATTLTFERGVSTDMGPVQVSYSLVECFNNEFSTQRGLMTIAASSASNTATISSVDTAKSLVIVSAKNNDTTDNESNNLVTGYLTNGTTVEASRYAASGTDLNVRYEVITFDSSVSVQTGNIDLTNNNASIATNITSVNTGRSWAYCSWNSSSNGLLQNAIGCELTNSTTITAHRYAASDYDNNVRYYVVEFPSGSVSVSRGIKSDDPASADDTLYSINIPIASIAKENKAFFYATNTTKGTSAYFPRQRWIYEFNDTDNLKASFWRSSPSSDVDMHIQYWQIMQFIQDVPSQPSIASAEDSNRNPDLTSSTYSGSGSHLLSDWKIVTANDCLGGVSVWEDRNDSVNKTGVTVNSTDGDFIGPLSGQTELVKDTVYYACVRYANAGGDSLWSTGVAFNTNIVPDASSAVIQSGAGNINLIPDGTKGIYATATIIDGDSCQDVASVSAKLYRTSFGADGADNANYRYSATCAVDENSCSGPSDTEAVYTCNFNVYFFADPTDPLSSQPDDNWSVRIKATDEVGFGQDSSDSVEINSLAALAVNSSIDFGSLSLGDDTGATNQIIEIRNVGNINIDVNLSAFASNPGDNNAMSCASGIISLGYLHYFTSAFTYASGQDVPGGTTEINLNINKSTGSPSVKNLYFGLGAPSTGIGGSCSGNIIITVVSDSGMD